MLRYAIDNRFESNVIIADLLIKLIKIRLEIKKITKLSATLNTLNRACKEEGRELDKALIEAVESKKLDKIKALLVQGVDIHIRNKIGSTLLTISSESYESSGKITELLIEYGADVNGQCLGYGETPLISATRHANS
jgi:ankyrin repeat protein